MTLNVAATIILSISILYGLFILISFFYSRKELEDDRGFEIVIIMFFTIFILSSAIGIMAIWL